jgi:stage II sporulation protein AA (anti-sigma F factor antagonist)
MSDSTIGESLDLRIDLVDSELAVVAVEGTIDAATAPRLKQSISGAIVDGRRLIVVDLSLCDFIDSTALAVLVAAWLRLQGTGRLVLAAGQRSAGATIHTAGIDRTLDVVANRGEALAALRGSNGAPAAP